MSGNNLKLADEFADEYDNSVVKNNWTGPQILFEMVADKLQPKSEILDIGIGTGESSLPFFHAGHSITGVDGSKRMLEQCEKKNITKSLIQINLETESLPFSHQYFDLAISNGVFHLISPIDNLFSAVSRILKDRAYFAFTFENAEKTEDYAEVSPGIWKQTTLTGVCTYKYSCAYISTLLENNNFVQLKQSTFLAFQNKELQKDFYFTAIVAQLR